MANRSHQPSESSKSQAAIVGWGRQWEKGQKALTGSDSGLDEGDTILLLEKVP